ncbi:hypothetical protein GC170_20430 [bacterium]|nr:hypothetical protein [bacterium]
MKKPARDRQDVCRIFKLDRITVMNTLTARGARIQPRVVTELLSALEVEVAQLNCRQEKRFTLHGRKLSPEAVINAILSDYLSLPADQRHAILDNGLRSVEVMLDTAPAVPEDRARIAAPAARKSPRKATTRKAKTA